MGAESPNPVSEQTTAWPALGINKRRVLGVLVEKAKTTPDVYPLSLNSLVTGCNQKSNRDPVLDLTELDVEEALDSAQKKGLVSRVIGGRVERWRHHLYEIWHADKVELAILAELLLRGPQTEGELRGRASRMEPIADLDALRAILKPLAERRLVVYLTPEGRRGTVLTHGFHAPEELKKLKARDYGADQGPVSIPSVAPMRSPNPPPSTPLAGNSEVIAALESRLTATQKEIAELRALVTDLAGQVRALREALGA